MDCNSSSSFPNGTRLDALLFDWCCDDNGFIWPPSVVPFSTQLDCDEGCYATFPADADIGGIGVLAAFVAACGITVIIATLASMTPWQNVWTSAWWLGRDAGYSSQNSSFTCAVCSRTLIPLADLQAITGIGVIIAAFVRWNTATFYHLGLVECYWWLTLNSMIAAEQLRFVFKVESSADLWKAKARTIARIVSFSLGIIFEIRWIKKVNAEWSVSDPGKCYRWKTILDIGTVASDCFWIATLIVAWAALIMSLWGFWDDFVRRLNGRWIEKEEGWIRKCWDDYIYQNTTSVPLDAPKSIQTLAKPMLFALVVLSWTFRQFLGFWDLFRGAPEVSIFFYWVFLIQISYTAVNLKVLNRPLLVGSEDVWGFGQVLPLILLLGIVFNFLDAFVEAWKTSSSASRSHSTNGASDFQQGLLHSTGYPLTNLQAQDTSRTSTASRTSTWPINTPQRRTVGSVDLAR